MPNKAGIKSLIRLLPGLFHCLLLSLRFRLINGRSDLETGVDHKRVLVVKLDAIGDFILWLDAAKELRRVYPPNEYLITLLGNRHWTDLARTVDCFDEVLAINRPSFFAQPADYSEILKRICSTRFDAVLHPVYSREFLFGDLFVWASHGEQKIGMRGDGSNLCWWQRRLGDRCYTDLVPGDGERGRELEHNALFLRWLGLTDFRAGVPTLQGAYKSPFVQLPADYYVVIAGAGVTLRMWPVSSFIALIERVHALTGMTAVVCGGRGEEELGRTLEGGASAPVINLTGQTSLTELVAVISEADFMVGNETGGIHIAAALGVPSVCIMGGGHFGRFVPYAPDGGAPRQLPVPVFRQMECFGCNWECIYSVQPGRAAPCVEMNSLESVLSAVMTLIENQQGVQRHDN